MANKYLLMLSLGLGIIFQAYVSLNRLQVDKDTRWKFSLILILPLVAFVLPTDTGGYNTYLHVSFYFLIFLFMFVVLFGNKILPIINEESLLILNILFLFDFFYYDYGVLKEFFLNFRVHHHFFAKHGLMIVTEMIMIPSVFVMLEVFIPGKSSRSIKSLFYTWYLIMLSVFLAGAIIKSNLIDFLFQNETTQYSKLAMFSVGMVLINLSNNFVYVASMWPTPVSEDESWSEAIARVNNTMDLLSSRYLNKDLHINESLLLSGALIVMLLLNYYFFKIEEIVIVSFVLVFIQFYYRTFGKKLKQDAG